MTDFRVALWPIDFSFPVASMEAWIALLEEKALAAKAQNADILVLPEYACVHWYQFAPKDLKAGDGFEWTESQNEAGLAGVAAVAKKTGLAILAGSYPVRAPKPYPEPYFKQFNDTRKNEALTRYFNRAYVFGADGTLVLTQDKMVLTPWELDEQGDNMQGGQTISSFMLNGVKVGVLVCLDVQQSAVVHALMHEGIEVLLVPSMTMHPSGYNRVFLNCRARAVEGMMGVAAVGGVGVPPYLVGRETNFAGAAIYGPCEMDMAVDGIILQSEPSYGMSMTHAGDVHVGAVPIDAIRRKRREGAEAWPGGIIAFKG
ncbi:MAG: hypothetical protein KGQ41_00645 [Alphaproteobacteria bacterium]|nr:hypothetical protein [Alphaproteobacteria bacterium]